MREKSIAPCSTSDDGVKADEEGPTTETQRYQLHTIKKVKVKLHSPINIQPIKKCSNNFINFDSMKYYNFYQTNMLILLITIVIM